MGAIISHVLSVFYSVFYLQTFGIILFIGMRAIISHVLSVFILSFICRRLVLFYLLL